MIGGTDLVLAGRSRPEDLEFIRRALLVLWPRAVCQPVVASEWEEFRRSMRPGTEFFVFRDGEAAEAWRRDGGIDDNADSMVHVILDDEETTFVVDKSGSALCRAVDELMKALAVNRLPLLRRPPDKSLGEAA